MQLVALVRVAYDGEVTEDAIAGSMKVADILIGWGKMLFKDG